MGKKTIFSPFWPKIGLFPIIPRQDFFAPFPQPVRNAS